MRHGHAIDEIGTEEDATKHHASSAEAVGLLNELDLDLVGCVT